MTATPPPVRTAPELQRLRRLAYLLDSSIGIPGTRWRFGLDALLGLLPGVGDGAGALVSAYVLLQAARLGAPRSTLLRMAGNVAVEALVGTIPLLGDLFDAAWKANQRNVRLLEAHLADARATERASRGWLLAIGLALVLLLVGAAALAVWIAAALLRALPLG